jgi:hypothetical protein
MTEALWVFDAPASMHEINARLEGRRAQPVQRRFADASLRVQNTMATSWFLGLQYRRASVKRIEGGFRRRQAICKSPIYLVCLQRNLNFGHSAQSSPRWSRHRDRDPL